MELEKETGHSEASTYTTTSKKNYLLLLLTLLTNWSFFSGEGGRIAGSTKTLVDFMHTQVSVLVPLKASVSRVVPMVLP